MRILPTILALLGFAAITVAMWGIWWQLGLVFTGVVLVALARFMDWDDPPPQTESKGFFTDTETTTKK